jgi:hypothetical protein
MHCFAALGILSPTILFVIESVTVRLSNEKEISHGRVAWQGCSLLAHQHRVWWASAGDALVTFTLHDRCNAQFEVLSGFD